MRGKLFGVGIGPGDPELLTLKAVRVLKDADVIAVPDTGGDKNAACIAGQFIEGKELIYCSTPMTRDQALLKESHKKSADAISKLLDEGKNVAFITLGDPSIYSTYMYIHRKVLQMGYDTELIPGIPSFCAAAAALNTSLCDGKEALHIIPASYAGAEEALSLSGNKILMKSGKSLAKIKETLKQKGFDQEVKMVECCSMPGEKSYCGINEIPEESSYFSILLVKDETTL